MKRLILVLVVATLASGCASYRPFQFAALDHVPDSATILGTGEGRACDTRILFFPPFIGTPENRLQVAVRAAVASKRGDALVNVTVDVSYRFYVLWSKHCTHVEGTVVKLKAS